MRHGVAMEGRMTGDPQGVCAWCGLPTMEVAYAPGLGRELPLHPTCGISIVYAFRRHLAGQPQRRRLTEIRIARLTAGPAQLASGVRCRCAVTNAHERPCPWPAPKGRARCPECVLTHHQRGRVTA